MKITNDKRIYNAACTWSKLNHILELNLNTHPDLIVVEPVCKGFTCELILKSIITFENHSTKDTHSLQKLFLMLNGKTQNIIKESTIEEMKKVNITLTHDKFLEKLNENANIFENWRYYYENDQRTDLGFINALFNSLVNYANKLFH